MADSTLNRFSASGTTAERTAFVPSAPTPASGPDFGYTWWDTDLQQLFSYNFGTAAWVAAAGGSVGGLVLLEQHTASASASLDFTSCFSSAYDEYLFEFVRVLPATDGVKFGFQVSYDGGGTWQTAGSSYFWVAWNVLSNLSTSVINDGQVGYASTYALLAPNVDTTIANGLAGVSGSMRFFLPGDAINHRYIADVCAYDNSGLDLHAQAFGRNTGTTAVNAMRFLTTSGNLASGTIRAYGLAK